MFTNVNNTNVEHINNNEQTLFSALSQSMVEDDDIASKMPPKNEFDSKIDADTTLNDASVCSDSKQLPVLDKKSIDRIVVFYSDKTFSEYRPE